MAENLVFILSAGRTGTQFLGRLLSQAIDGCWSEHEPDVFDGFNATSWQRARDFGLYHLTLGRALGRTGLRAIGTRYITGAMDLDAATQQLRAQRRAYHARISQPVLVESHGHWWPFAGHIGQIFPGAKSVGIIRDPRHWIASAMAHRRNLSARNWVYMFPPGPLTPARTGDTKWAEKWDGLSLIGRLAWQWQLINGHLAHGLDQDAAARIFRFEDLFGTAAKMDELIQFAADFPGSGQTTRPLDPTTAQRLNASGRAGDEWAGWSAPDKALIDDLCGPLMERFAYPSLRDGGA